MKKNLLPIVFLVLIGFFLYLPNFNNKLFWDDADWILNNPYVHGLSWENIKFIFSHDALAGIGLHSNYFRPFLFLTFLINYVVSGDNSIFYHLISNLIHIGNAVLIFVLLYSFLKKRVASFVAALLFLIHPLQTEAVTYISGRGDPLSVFLMFLALVFFLLGSGNWPGLEKIKCRWLFLGLSFVGQILAILSRETAFLFPLYLIVFQIAFIYRDKFWTSFKKSLIISIPYFVISFVYGILRLTVLNFQNTLNFYSQTNSYTEHLSYRIYTFFHAIAVYLRLIFVPVGLHMERDIPVNTSIFQWPVWLGILITGLIVWFGFWFYKNKKEGCFRIWFFAWGIFFINLGPTSGIFPINALIYEHWLYFSLFGFFALGGFYIDKILEFLKNKHSIFYFLFSIFLIAYFSFLGIQTIRRNIIWGDTESFYKNILYYQPGNIRVLNNLANYFSSHNRNNEAEELLKKIVNSDDNQPAPYYNLGNILRDRKDFISAIEMYQKAINKDPQFYYAYLNIAALYAGSGKLEESLAYLEKLRTIQPGNPMVYFGLGQINLAVGHKEKAQELFSLALKYAENNQELKTKIINFLNGVK